MSKQKITLLTFSVFTVLLILETLGREHDISYLRATKILKPLSIKFKQGFNALGVGIAYYLGQPLLFACNNLSEFLKYWAQEIWQSFTDVMTPLIVILLSWIHIIMGYLEQGDEIIKYYIGDNKIIECWNSWYGMLFIVGTFIFLGVLFKIIDWISYKQFGVHFIFWRWNLNYIIEPCLITFQAFLDLAKFKN